jgi:hypothetical protein
MEGADWLRTQLTHFGCAVCGASFPPERIRVLAQREDLFFVDLDCPGCGSGAVAIVTIEVEEDGPRLEPDGLSDLRPFGHDPDAVPVSASDVLEMHDFLRRFDGDFHRLFEPPRSQLGA